MVKKNTHCKRFAFTMIELIFAIVIIGISVISLPRMIGVINSGIDDNIVQEAIFAASSELIGASAGYWDENSMQDINVSYISRVIDISNDCNNTVASSRFGLRPGHIAQPFHRRCLDNLATVANNAPGGVNIDLNDATHGVANIFTNTTSDAAGYKETYNSAIAVNLNGNVKTITATITDADGRLITVLNMQSANIGEVDYFKRMF